MVVACGRIGSAMLLQNAADRRLSFTKQVVSVITGVRAARLLLVVCHLRRT